MSPNVDDRVTDLELKFMVQQDLIEQLDAEVLRANTKVEVLEKRLQRLEQTLEGVLQAVDVPVNERPPHY